jgi:NADH:ubiquinone oxidoreductase subunit 3 (subunit A)
MNQLSQILSIVSESPLALLAFVIFIIFWLIIKLQLGKAESLTKQIKHLPPEDRFRAIERLYSDVPHNSPESFLKAKRQYFRFAYYVSSLFFILAVIYIVLFYANKMIPSLLPFMPPPVEIVKEVPESGTVKSNDEGYVNFKRFLIDFNGCKKESTSSISCELKIENQSGDKEFFVYERESQIVEKSGDTLPCKAVKISNNNFSSSSKTKLISGIPTSAVYQFDGVAEDIDSVAALELVVGAEGENLTLQYKNVTLQ